MHVGFLVLLLHLDAQLVWNSRGVNPAICGTSHHQSNQNSHARPVQVRISNMNALLKRYNHGGPSLIQKLTANHGNYTIFILVVALV